MAVVNFSGLASGVDSSALISAYLDQQRSTRITPLQTKIEDLRASGTALDTLDSLLQTVRGSAEKFRAINGSALAKSVTSSSESRVSATASNSAVNGSYGLSVLSLAKNGNFSFDDRYSSSSAAINSSINNGASAASRTVTVQVGTGADLESVDVELTSSTTLSDFVTQFNSSSSKAEASVVNVGTAGAPSYAIGINSTNQGTAKGQLAVSVGSEVSTAGAGALTTNTLSQATDASFTVSGIAGVVTRASNTVNDVVAGLTLSFNTTGASTVTVTDDAATTVTSVQEFVDAFNAVRSFISENDLVTQDESTRQSIFGPLASLSLDENLMSSLRNSLTSASITGGLSNSLADLGITTERDGSLKLDQAKLTTAIGDDPESVRSIMMNLGDDVAGVDGLVAQYTRFGGLIDSAQSTFNGQIDSYTKSIERSEEYLDRQKQTMTAQYARLEAVIGKMNSQQSALAGLV